MTTHNSNNNSSCSVIVRVSVVLKRTVGDSDLSPTVLFRTTLTRTITLHELLILLGSNHLLSNNNDNNKKETKDKGIIASPSNYR